MLINNFFRCILVLHGNNIMFSVDGYFCFIFFIKDKTGIEKMLMVFQSLIVIIKICSEISDGQKHMVPTFNGFTSNYYFRRFDW